MSILSFMMTPSQYGMNYYGSSQTSYSPGYAPQQSYAEPRSSASGPYGSSYSSSPALNGNQQRRSDQHTVLPPYQPQHPSLPRSRYQHQQSSDPMRANTTSMASTAHSYTYPAPDNNVPNQSLGSNTYPPSQLHPPTSYDVGDYHPLPTMYPPTSTTPAAYPSYESGQSAAPSSASILFSVTAALCITCCYYGSGQLARDLSILTMAKGIKLFYVAEYFYAVSAMFIKISVAVTLLRIAAAHPQFIWALWALIGATAIAALVFCIGIANVCHPINALWGKSDGTCNLQLNTDVSLFFSAIEIITDFSLSIMPAILLRNVQMKSKVKVSVAVMLALASLASCATIVRLKYLTLYSDPGDFIYGTGKIGFWSLTEEGIGIIAGSLPALRPLLSLRIKFTTSSSIPAATGSAHPPIPNGRQTLPRSGVMIMSSLPTLRDNDEDDHSDGDSQRNIIKETTYTVTSREVAVTGGDRKQGQVMRWDYIDSSRV
ncbi:uncharacterized protein ALTATR162_LOCUS150 [Alternaria atra]|uniref:Rhodopsin domain-containing protein n=1 Tax=Alternaria atra TaxID=119953 RepID=A0A8J2N117_9PLEO|nr:uncharacterized protein ALTATR162_LOCUS150 [Alternaria atra]CAG5137562.1 unnamed protein product [Alternaria atra]